MQADFATHGLDLPVYWGNRNWSPYLTDELARIADDGHGRVLVLLTSAYSSYSGCRQYRENLAAAVAPLGDRAPQVDRIRHYFNHPGFVEAMVTSTVAALDELPADVRARRPAGVRHALDPHVDGRRRADRTATRTAGSTATWHGWSLPASRPRPAPTTRSTSSTAAAAARPTQPWLEPDVNDHLESLVADGVPAAVLVPIGFVSDHMEVKYDLDTEARATAERLGLPVARAATVGTDPAFVAAVRELVLERAALVRGETPVRRALGELGPSHDVCPAGCCPNARDPERPALCGA